MTLTISLPDNYPYVILSSVVAPFVTNIMMGGPVMRARKRFDVPYPNLYATPGHHKEADAFNRVQRGHQSMFETLPHLMSFALVGGLQYPLVSAVSALAYCLGSYFFLQGYSDTSLDVKSARYKKGGGLKWLGLLGAFFTCCSTCYSMLRK